MNRTKITSFARVIFALSFLLAGCAGTSQRTELKTLQVRATALEQALQAEKAKNQELTTELQSLRPPASGDTVLLTDLLAVPEQYEGKMVITEGRLDGWINRHPDVSAFSLRATSNAGVLCAYENAKLDENSRRLLLTKQGNSITRVEGQLYSVKVRGLTMRAGMTDQSGYEFIVSKVLQ